MFIIICDGGNRNDITYGSFKIFSDSGELIVHKQMVFGYGTSNLAEYLALISALEEAIKRNMKDIIVLTDSKLMQEQIMGDWACNYKHLKVARNKARKLLRQFDSWKIVKVIRNIVVAQLGH